MSPTKDDATKPAGEAQKGPGRGVQPQKPDEAFDAAWDDAAESLSDGEEGSEQGSSGDEKGPGPEPSGEAEVEDSERRRYDRVDVGAQISMSSETNLYAGLTSDLSEGGVFVSTYQTLPVGTAVDLDLSFEEMGGPRIAARAEVRWIREESAGTDAISGMGLRFVELGEDDRKWIADFVKRREPIFHEEAGADSAGQPVAALGGEPASDRDLLTERSPLVGLAMLAGAGALVLALGYLLFFTGGDDDAARRVGKVTPATESEVTNETAAEPVGVKTAPAIVPATDSRVATPDSASGSVAESADGSTGDAIQDAASSSEDSAATAEQAPAAPSASASTDDRPAAIRAGLQMAAAIRPCLAAAAAEGATLKLALYVQASGKVVRGFAAGTNGTKLTRPEVKCIRARVRGSQLPIVLKKADFVEWRLTLRADGAEADLIKPRYLLE